MESFRGRSDQLWRGIEVRKALGEVNRPILMGNPRHLSDDRFGKPLQSVGGRQHQSKSIAGYLGLETGNRMQDEVFIMKIKKPENSEKKSAMSAASGHRKITSWLSHPEIRPVFQPFRECLAAFT
jgi:hypothetical protein